MYFKFGRLIGMQVGETPSDNQWKALELMARLNDDKRTKKVPVLITKEST